MSPVRCRDRFFSFNWLWIASLAFAYAAGSRLNRWLPLPKLHPHEHAPARGPQGRVTPPAWRPPGRGDQRAASKAPRNAVRFSGRAAQR